MQGLMAGKRGLVMGIANDHSIAWGIAKTLAAHGAEMAFTYQGDALGKRVRPLAEELGSPESYAAGFQKDRVAAPRRRAWAVTALVLLILATRLPGVVAGERLSVWDVAYLLLAVVVLVWTWLDYRAAVRRARR